jgi:predicted amidohydrolase
MRSTRKVEENIETASALIREAAAKGAALITTPEMTSLIDRTPGVVAATARLEGDDLALKAFRALADELKAWLLIGSLPIRRTEPGPSGATIANRSFLIGPDGAIAARYDKIHMFDVQLNPQNVYRESKDYAAGDEAVIAKLPDATLGLTVCYDVRFPHLYRTLAKAGAEIVTCPAAFTRVTGEAHWHVLLRARAIETGCFVLAPAQEGRHEDGRETYGHSLMIGPWGEILAEAGEGPGVTTATLDLEEVARARSKIPALTHDRDMTLRRI